jgi:hypothetical protein
LGQNKEVKSFDIASAYAVIDPGAVVVKTTDTFVADLTVPGTRFLDYLAVGTQGLRIKFPQQLHKINRLITFQVARVAQFHQNIGYNRQNKQNITCIV